MDNYVRQFDIPCYPNDKPKSGVKLIAGIQKGNTFDKQFKGYTFWIGGCSHGQDVCSLDVAMTTLTIKVLDYLKRRQREFQK